MYVLIRQHCIFLQRMRTLILLNFYCKIKELMSECLMKFFFRFFNKISTIFILMICLDFFWKTPAGVTKNQEIINLIKSININEQQ